MITIPGTHLSCKNCGSNEFKQIKIDSWQCSNCGKVKHVQKNKSIMIERKQLSKESITTSKRYKPVIAYCSNCGEKIDRIGHPRDQRRLNNKWANHNCKVKKRNDVFYQ